MRKILLCGTVLVVAVAAVLAVDSDNDGMSDLYESFFGLNVTNSLDATENYDTDNLNNLQESVIWTDPNEADTDADGNRNCRSISRPQPVPCDGAGGTAVGGGF